MSISLEFVSFFPCSAWNEQDLLEYGQYKERYSNEILTSCNWCIHIKKNFDLQKGFFTGKYFNFLENLLRELQSWVAATSWKRLNNYLSIYLFMNSRKHFLHVQEFGLSRCYTTSPESYLSWQLTKSRIEITCMRHMGFTVINSLACGMFVLQKDSVRVFYINFNGGRIKTTLFKSF